MTDQIAPMPQPGWYPDPEESVKYLRYWDGQQWTVRLLQPRAQVGDGDGSAPGNVNGSEWSPAPRSRRRSWKQRALGGGFSALSRVLGIGLVLTLFVCGGQLVLHVWGVSMIDDAVANGDSDKLDSFDNLDIAASMISLLLLNVVGIAWMIWQYRLARSIPPGELDRTPPWHAWSWVIPIAALWMPIQNVRDLWHRMLPLRSMTWLGWWWAAWLLGELVSRIAAGSADDVDSVQSFRGTVITEAIADALTLVAAVLALMVVRRLTAAAFDRQAQAVSANALSQEAPPAG